MYGIQELAHKGMTKKSWAVASLEKTCSVLDLATINRSCWYIVPLILKDPKVLCRHENLITAMLWVGTIDHNSFSESSIFFHTQIM